MTHNAWFSRSIIILSSLVITSIFYGCASAPSTSKPLPSIDLANFDTSVSAAENFYVHVNGGWLNSNAIPDDKSNYGAFSEIADKTELQLRDIIESAPEGSAIANMHKSFMDTATIEQLGLTPIDNLLKAIDRTDSHANAMVLMHALQRTPVGSPIGFWINQDAKNTTEYAVHLSQSGLGLPDRDYYFDDNFSDAREAYKAYIATMYTLAGFKDNDARAMRVWSLEKDIASAHWTRVKNRDRDATYNKLTLNELQTSSPNLKWPTFFKLNGMQGKIDSVIVRQPNYFTSLNNILVNHPIEAWQDYLRLRVLSSFASMLSEDFVAAKFDFYGRTLSGTTENRPRWKRAISATEGALSDEVGKQYVEKHFKPEAKARMDELVLNLREAFATSIDNLEWMSDDTKAQAREKLAKFTFKIGYPEQWKDYSKLVIKSDDLVGNVLRSYLFEFNHEINKLGKPIDRNEWFMSPQTVNAYYNPSMNEIVFPAAILQPPFFDVNADDALNYGGIGAVIGHEFSHGFDDQGRKSDGDGTLVNWWTDDDLMKFNERTEKLVAQYNNYSPLEGLHVNGELTLGENIADVAGLTMAHRAYMRSLNGAPAPDIGGFSGDQRFFIGWTRGWRRLYRDDELAKRLTTDSHSPSEYRVNGVVGHVPAFYDAFNVTPDDAMYIAPEQRVDIW